MAIPPKTHLGHYEILSSLGAGGMGEVYLARDMKLDRLLAIKVLPTNASGDSQRLRRFVQEARAASALNHPNIAHIYEIDEVDGIRFIAMEFVEGESLQTRIAGPSVDFNEVIRIGAQAADALSQAHAKGVVHRDIKASNIMLTTRGQVKILDFGLAKIESDSIDENQETQLKTGAGVVMGTLPYMSPEQALGQPVDHRSDIFSLGTVLYQLVTGRLPFSGKTATETLNLITQAQPEAIARFNYEAPPELERIIRKCLEKERERRYQSAADLVVDLENLKRDSQANVLTPGTSQPPGPTKRNWMLAAAVVLVLLAIGATYYVRKRNGSAFPNKRPGSIAVLPFTNATGDQNTEYLSDGITESIINSLSQLPEMRVMARATMFRYKGKNVDPQAVGRELGVDAVVTGKALQQGETLVVQVDLMNVADGSQVWGDRFNRKVSDVLAIQDEIARQIADKLRLQLSGKQDQLLTKRYTDNTEAYNLYLKGQFFFRKLTEQDLLKSIDYYQQAIAKDPNYALAYVGAADSYSDLGGVLGFRSPAETFPKANEFALRALQIDDGLAEAHYALAYCKLYNEWKWNEAERELKRALELNPNDASTHGTYGTYFQSLGLFDQAVAERQLAKKFDPLSPLTVANVGYPLYYARRFDEAIRAYREALELDPTFAWSHLWIGQVYLLQGKHREAIDEINLAISGSNGDIRMVATLGHAYAVAGNRREALRIIEKLQQASHDRYVSPYFIAVIHVGLENNDEAFVWLEKAYEERHPYMILMSVEPVFDKLRSDPRFQDLERRVGLRP